jgi:hypothetical protein
VNLYWLSAAYAAKANKDSAFTMMQKALDSRFRDFAAITASPYFSSLRSDSHFQRLIQGYH